MHAAEDSSNRRRCWTVERTSMYLDETCPFLPTSIAISWYVERPWKCMVLRRPHAQDFRWYCTGCIIWVLSLLRWCPELSGFDARGLHDLLRALQEYAQRTKMHTGNRSLVPGKVPLKMRLLLASFCVPDCEQQRAWLVEPFPEL